MRFLYGDLFNACLINSVDVTITQLTHKLRDKDNGRERERERERASERKQKNIMYI